ncbi:ZIP family metal transporter [Haloarcula sp. 1CSR25-25]|uniref:ZIP family metal transporter n=1 Tax=Haloarcula sp. 1CSR25-25 TaxID=2862545 RepID=UPI002896FACD|nr:ZIP family metal transporter [Haloarcula sp. 1CSR25-25]
MGIFAGVAVDLFSDGVMIGAGSTISLGLGLLLALGQVPADIPEGFATIATFKSKGVPRRTRLLLSLSFALPIFLGVTVGYWLVRGQPAIVKFGLLAFTAGILLTVAVEEIIPEAHKEGEARLAAVALVGGFALFTFISIYLG